ncbi:hypothetical protein PF005_g18940 [Phytophthora fragariae]|uniref:RxLR effector protein n=1 Tax=Phytophthora fragariae TaxID=53985 RepID=A0A6A3J9H6_9STRA|nr:hypothetical protein PF003_g2674 [Phytophthora fragariae]KAE8929434.1 hypothetical protein PF009_g20448 [Phytophthora fragariae]KAE8990962.1 hypothetical protein PF011_g18135 [Phytophthora fragariae]KAE9089405.1 hypothetical protein PF010_g19005 [Phytophthora fragariae]KAE9090176.1 hypothetical protein PF007_g19335 [Phytophthora fragariae]
MCSTIVVIISLLYCNITTNANFNAEQGAQLRLVFCHGTLQLKREDHVGDHAR